MSEGGATRWWQTIPGALTALAAVITAITGLIVVLRPAMPPSDRPSVPSTSQTDGSITPPAGGAVLPAGRGVAGASRTIALPSPSEVKLADGTAVIRILSMRIEPYNAERRSLVISLRYTNNRGYAANFWDSTFRLLVDDVPRAPTGGLNKVVEAHSADEGDVVFQIPATATSVTLRMINGDEHTDIPLTLTAAG